MMKNIFLNYNLYWDFWDAQILNVHNKFIINNPNITGTRTILSYNSRIVQMTKDIVCHYYF